MIEVNATLFALLLEASALLATALAVLGVVAWRRGTQMRRVLRALVAEINGEAEARLRLAGERIAARGEGDDAKRLNQCERSVCQAMVRALSQRRPELLVRAYAELKALADGYQTLLAAAAVSPSQAQAEAAKDAALRTLKSDYEKATRELAITQRTMEKMLREYSSMFAGGADDDIDHSAMMEQMKSAAAPEIEDGSTSSAPSGAQPLSGAGVDGDDGAAVDVEVEPADAVPDITGEELAAALDAGLAGQSEPDGHAADINLDIARADDADAPAADAAADAPTTAQAR